MSFPNPAQRIGWFAQQYEKLPLEGHAPTATTVDSSRCVPACRCECIDPNEPGVLIHADRDTAVDQAFDILHSRIHGPTNTETP